MTNAARSSASSSSGSPEEAPTPEESAYSVHRLVETPESPAQDTALQDKSSEARANGEDLKSENSDAQPVTPVEKGTAREESEPSASGPLRLGVWVDEHDRFGFVEQVLERLPERYEATTFHTFRAGIEDQVRADLDRVDLAWFEWAEGPKLDLADYTTDTPLLCRIHPRLAGGEPQLDAAWTHVDHWVFPAPGAERNFRSRQRALDDETVHMIPTGIDVDIIEFDPSRQSNGHIALYAPLRPADNPSLLLQVLEALIEQDDRFNLHITGAAQHPAVASYVRQQAEARGIDGHIHFYGAISPGEREVWLDQCTYVLSTRLMDGDWTGVVEAMARGLKPVIHAFPGAEQLFAPNMLFETVEEAVALIADETPQPQQYRRFARRRYQIDRQVDALVRVLDRMAADYYPDRLAAYHHAKRAEAQPTTDAAPGKLLEDAAALHEEGELEEAAETMSQLDFDVLDDAEALEARILALHIDMGREAFADALFHADAALDYASDEPHLLHLAGRALWAEDHREAAADALVYAAELLDAAEEEGRELQFDVDPAQVYFMAGEACETFGHADEARHFFDKAQQHAPDEELIQQAVDRIRSVAY